MKQLRITLCALLPEKRIEFSVPIRWLHDYLVREHNAPDGADIVDIFLDNRDEDTLEELYWAAVKSGAVKGGKTKEVFC